MKALHHISSLAISLALICTACQQRKNIIPVGNTGEKLFGQYCVRCHLNTGQGGPTPGDGISAADIRKFDKTPAELVDIISHGFGQMPAFGDSISKEDIDILANYVAASIERK